ncbi:hypothetical protein HPB47_022017 [Ixodes persulcatus]|uniref:Uncharacterized protein n=1 Tax=Ixodes persulcatus TaxID=34615 RepID=A0AC60QAW2_IXOPE|nr:hypothetical protein HPB47_022017 [Ixodes persulcatus]
MLCRPRGTPDFGDVRASFKARRYEAPPALEGADDATAVKRSPVRCQRGPAEFSSPVSLSWLKHKQQRITAAPRHAEDALCWF